MSNAHNWWLADNRIYDAIITKEEDQRPHTATATATVEALIKDFNKQTVLVRRETMAYDDKWLSGVYPITFDQIAEQGVTQLGQAWLQLSITEDGEETFTADMPIILNRSL